MPYKVKLESFEGPLDLLLYLIKKNEIDIYDIPISAITRQYLEYIEILQLLDIEAASDFILMAATLMRIKAQMLLPRPDFLDEEEEIQDPRQELVFRLLEYKRFKDVAFDLGDKEQQARKFFPRGNFSIERSMFDEEFLQSSDVTLFDLVAAFKKIVEKSKKVTVHRVEDINITLEQRYVFLERMLVRKNRITFSELFDPKDERIVWIVTFIALLELLRQRIARALQSAAFDEIIIERVHG